MSNRTHHVEFSRICEELERERDDLKERLAEAHKDYACLATLLDGHDATECRSNLERIIGSRRELLEALTFYADVTKYPAPKTGGLGELYFDCGEKARSAIANATGKEGE